MEVGAMPKERILDPRQKDPRSGIDAALSVRWTKNNKREPNCSPLGNEPLVVTYDRMNYDGPNNIDQIAGFIALDRDACNRLIRSLRRARDDVYGKDE